jgi:transposase-like protein
MGRWRRERELHWRGVLQRQAESGLTVAEYCRQESISGPSFYSWKRKLKERDTRSQAENHPGDTQSAAGQFLPVRIESVGPAASVRILLPQGTSLDVPSSIAPASLIDLLQALREAHLC